MWNFLIFRRMITPVLIQILFWISEIAVVVEAIGRITGAQGRPAQRMNLPVPMQIVNQGWLSQRTEGILLLIIGPVVVRIFYELLILVCRLTETLTDIRHTPKRAGMPASRPGGRARRRSTDHRFHEPKTANPYAFSCNL